MLQGLLIWAITLLLAFLLADRISQRQRHLSKRFLVILFLYHSLFAIAYYSYALFNPSDSHGYYRKVIVDFRGEDWGSFFGISTTFIEFVGYPFIKYFGFTYESTMVVFSFFGYLGFVFFYVFFKERVKYSPRYLGIDFLTLVFLLPNLHFWSSSFGKGSMIFCGFGLFFYALNRIGFRLWALLIGGWIIFMVRPHVFYVILIAIAIGYTFSTRGVAMGYRVVILVAAAFLLYTINEDILRLTGLDDDSIFEADFSIRADRLTRATSGIDISNYSIPEKLFTFWFRPLFFDAPGLLGLLVSFENLFYLVVFAMLLQPRAIGYLWNGEAIVKTSLLTFLGVSYALAQISGNLGVAIRQKSQVMMLMLFVILKFIEEKHASDIRRLESRRKAMQRMRPRTSELESTS